MTRIRNFKVDKKAKTVTLKMDVNQKKLSYTVSYANRLSKLGQEYAEKNISKISRAVRAVNDQFKLNSLGLRMSRIADWAVVVSGNDKTFGYWCTFVMTMAQIMVDSQKCRIYEYET